MNLGNFGKALESLISLVHEDNLISLPQILEGIIEMQEKGLDLTKEQLQKVKSLFDTYDETVQELAFKVYSTSIFRNINLFKDEIDNVISKLDTFESRAKDNAVDFLITTFSEFSKYQKLLIHGLLTSLNDDLWNIRMKIIEFLNDIFVERPNLISDFHKELEVLLDEKDIDVIREGLDFLLRVYFRTYKVEDLKKLIESIPKRDWIAQEKILFLIGKLGIKRKELIKPIIRDLVYLLDYEDYLVNERAIKTIEEIMGTQVDLFDDAFFSFIQNNEIDNLGAIEDLLKFSVIKHGFERFFDIYKHIPREDESLIKIFNNMIKKLHATNPKLVESLFSQLINEILKDLNVPNYINLKRTLEQFQQYNVYLICYQALTNQEKLRNFEKEERRTELIKYLREKMSSLDELRKEKIQEPIKSEIIEYNNEKSSESKSSSKFELNDLDLDTIIEVCNRIINQLDRKAMKIQDDKKEFSSTFRIVEKAKNLRQKMLKMLD